MTDVSWSTVGGLIFRRILQSAAGYLFAHGILVAPGAVGVTIDMFMSAGLTAGSIALSIWQKKGQAAALSELRIMANYWRNRNKPAKPSA